jgi:hypothetical protein
MRFEHPCIIHCQEVVMLVLWWDQLAANGQLHLHVRHGIIYSYLLCAVMPVIQTEVGGGGLHLCATQYKNWVFAGVQSNLCPCQLANLGKPVSRPVCGCLTTLDSIYPTR